MITWKDVQAKAIKVGTRIYLPIARPSDGRLKKFTVKSLTEPLRWVAIAPTTAIPCMHLSLSGGYGILLPLSAPTWSEIISLSTDALALTLQWEGLNPMHWNVAQHNARLQWAAHLTLEAFLAQHGGVRRDWEKKMWVPAGAKGSFNKNALVKQNTQLEYKFLSTTVMEFVPMTGFTVLNP